MTRKIRNFKRYTAQDGIETPHPDGGTFWTRPMTFAEAEEYSKVIAKYDFERVDGKVLFGPDNQPVKKSTLEMSDFVGFSMQLVTRIEDVSAGAGVITTMTDLEGVERAAAAVVKTGRGWAFLSIEGELLEELSIDGTMVTATTYADEVMKLPATDEIEVEVAIDAAGKVLPPDAAEELKAGTKKIKRPETEPYFLWVARKSAKYREELNGVVKGN